MVFELRLVSTRSDERRAIRNWLHIVLLKGIFGGAVDTILSAIRRAFIGEEFQAPYVTPTIERFPVADIGAILRAQGRDPQVTKEFIDSLLYTEKEEKLAFAILALLRPDLEHFCVRWDRIRHWRDSSGTRWAEPDRGAGRRFAIEPLWCAWPPCAVAL